MDYVLGVPKVFSGLDLILVAVDRLSKMTHFHSCSKIDDASHVAKLVFREEERLDGLPTSIVSEADCPRVVTLRHFVGIEFFSSRGE